MTIQQVQLANTFNEFRTTFNDAANVINGLQDGTQSSNVTTLIAQTANATTVNSTTVNVTTLNSATGNFTDSTDSTTVGQGALKTSGGLSVQKQMHVGANAHFEANVIIGQNLIVNGNTISLNVSTFEIEDSIIYVNSNNTITNPDLGLAGNYNDGSGYRHAGMFRDATDGVWKFFDGYQPEPADPIDIANATFNIANVEVTSLKTKGVELLDTDKTHKVTLKAPSVVSANLNLTVPNSNASSNGDCLVSDTSGNLRYEARASTGKAIAMAIVFGG